MSKTKKKASRQGKTLIAGASEAHNAADNPLSSPLTEGEDPIEDHRSDRNASVGEALDQNGQVADRPDQDDPDQSNGIVGDQNGHPVGENRDRGRSPRSRDGLSRRRDNRSRQRSPSVDDEYNEDLPSLPGSEDEDALYIKRDSEDEADQETARSIRARNREARGLDKQRERDSRNNATENQGRQYPNNRGGDRHPSVPDENIQRALDELNNPQRRRGETRDEYNARLAASARQRQGNPAVNEKSLKENKERARRERRAEKTRDERDSDSGRYPPSEDRREDYRQWLNTQLYLDSMREDDLRQTGKSIIPPREKRAAYPGMARRQNHGEPPREIPNATPGPSRPRGKNDNHKKGPTRWSKDRRRMESDPPNGDDPSDDDGSYDPSDTGDNSDERDSTDTRSSRRSRQSNHSRRGRQNRGDPSDDPSDSSDSDARSRRSRRSSHSSRRHRRDERSSRRSRSQRSRGYDRGASYSQSMMDRRSLPIENVLQQDYEHGIMLRYRRMIRDRVGQSRDGLADVKGIKVSPPEKYGGEDDIEIFDAWIAGLLRWLRVQNVCGPKRDVLRVDLCGTTLKGLAADWFAEEVESFHRAVEDWLFEDVVCALYKRFIHRVTAQNAADKYRKTKFSKADGALAFYNEMKRHANRMVQPPDEYSFKRAFLNGLPQELVENLMKSRQVSAEHTPLDILLEEVKAMENNLQAVENHRHSRREDGPHSRSTNTTQASNNTRPTRTVRFVRREPSRPPRSDSQRRPDGQRQKSSFRSNDGNKQGSRPPSRPPTSDRTRERPRSSQAEPSHNHTHDGDSTVKCFNCGKPGHYSRNCPTRPRVFAAQVIDEDEGSPSRGKDDEEDDGRGDSANVKEDAAEGSASDQNHEGPGGSQYDSERGTESPIEYFEYVEANSSDDEDEGVVFIRASRVPGEGQPIPSDWYPIDLLKALPPSERAYIFSMRRKEEDPLWSPSPNLEENNPLGDLPLYLVEIGYSAEDQYADADWLERMATRHPSDFQSLTGYQCHTPPKCDECGECLPQVEETLYTNSEGVIIPRYRMVCEKQLPIVDIRAMSTNDDTATSDASTGGETRDDASELVPIPEGWYPIDILHALTDVDRVNVFLTRKRDDDPMWTPSEAPEGDDPKGELPVELVQLGYTTADEFADADWLEGLMNREYDLFQQITGYRKRYDCPVCGDCVPRVDEVRAVDFDGNVYHRLGLVCGRSRPRPFTQLTSTSSPCIRAMGTPDETPRVYRASMRRPMGTIRRPTRRDGEQLCLAAYIKLNGVKAYTLFDSGSTTDSVSPDFTRVAMMPVKTLEDPVTLQLGCVGSRSKINYGTEVDLEFASITNSTYLDIANLDKYDSILGTPFLRRNGISLDFENQEIVIRGQTRIPALPEGEGTAAAINSPRSTRKQAPRQ
jgi:hypothetical protein